MKYFDDDMDELFNKAGRDYPLKTEPKDWDAVRGALHPGEALPATQRKNGWRRYLPLLLLLLIPLSVYVFVERKGGSINNIEKRNSVSSNDVNKKEKLDVDQSIRNNSGSDKSIKNNSVSDKSIKNNSVSDKLNKNKSEADNTIKKNLVSDKSIKNKSASDQSSKNNLASDKPFKNHSEADNTIKKNLASDGSENRTDSKFSLSPNKTRPNISDTKKHISKYSLNKNLSSKPSSNSSSNNKIRDLLRWNKFPPNGEFEKAEVNVPVKAQNRSEGTQSVPNAKKKKHSNKTGIYYGIGAAPDLSMIKGQKIRGTGYSAGIIAGYQFNGHWSVEAGLLWSRKKYFTSGKYFNKEGARIPETVNVMWLDGGCDMFEIPLLARYDFSLKKNTFFVAAGLISYMMKKEDYKYGAKAGPAQWYYVGEREYDRSGDHLFSNLQLSAGYKFSLSPKMNVRIEPYLKAPLKKIGIGKMPITSAGLSIGITRDFR